MQHRSKLYKEVFNSQAGAEVLKDLNERYFNQLCFGQDADPIKAAIIDGQRRLVKEINNLAKDQ